MILGISAVTAGALASAGALAQPAQPQEPPVWQMDRGAQYCTLIRLPDESVPFHVAVRTTPGSEFASLLLIARGEQRLPEGISAVALGPSGRAFPTSGEDDQRIQDGRIVWLGPLPEDFRGALGEASELELKAGEEVRYRIPLTHTQGAAAALRRCTTEIARQWGVDEPALEALKRRPATTNFLGITSGDYPSSALRQHMQGRVVVRVTVSADGRATACAPVASSGYALLDNATCRPILHNARFTPALDSSDRPVEATIIGGVRWRLP